MFEWMEVPEIKVFFMEIIKIRIYFQGKLFNNFSKKFLLILSNKRMVENLFKFLSLFSNFNLVVFKRYVLIQFSSWHFFIKITLKNFHQLIHGKFLPQKRYKMIYNELYLFLSSFYFSVLEIDNLRIGIKTINLTRKFFF